MRHHSYGALAFTAAAVVVATACDDQGLTRATPADAPALVASAETCEVVNFDGFANGDPITSLSVLGMPLTVSMTPSPISGSPQNLATAPRAWDTDGDPADGWEDLDLLWNTPGGLCADCNGLHRIMVIEDERGFLPTLGDSRWGGTIHISGFSGPGLYVKSYKAVDNDSNERPIRLVVGPDTVGVSSRHGNGSVETVLTSPHVIGGSISFVLGTMESDNALGSGGIDDITVCRPLQEEIGDEGCTLGYWKQEHHFDSWTTYTPGQTLQSVFDVPDSYGLDTSTLLQALGFKGGSGEVAAARLLLKQAVAAVLNAASPDVDYALTTTEIVDQVDAALAGGNRNTMLALAGQLDGYNNEGCPLD